MFSGTVSEISASSPAPEARSDTHIHDCIDLCDSLVICGKLVDLDPVADQLTHDLDLELVELALGDHQHILFKLCMGFSLLLHESELLI